MITVVVMNDLQSIPNSQLSMNLFGSIEFTQPNTTFIRLHPNVPIRKNEKLKKKKTI